jgi:cinnamyl-alcohol dehydrogenase
MGEVAGATEVQGYAARDTSGHLTPFKFTRTPRGPGDVTFKVLFCGICHSDLHQMRNEWMTSKYPMVPGHEIIGTVTEVGSAVTNFKIGDTVGVGCMVSSCLKCDSCEKGLENYCEKIVWTYNSVYPDGAVTQGGYSTIMMADQRFVLHIPENLPKDAAAPLLCAGITVWSPMQYFGMNVKGARFGVVGLGGLGHMAVQFGKAFGMHVTIFSTSPKKEKEAREILGADDFVVSKDAEAMKAKAKSIDFIIDTVSAKHPMDDYLSLLKTNGKICLVGLPSSMEITPVQLTAGRRLVAGSTIGGIKETAEMLEFCGKNNITCMVETLPISECNKALERLEKNDVKYRFVLDLKALQH